MTSLRVVAKKDWNGDKMKKGFQVCKKVIGAREIEDKKWKVLNRIIRVSSSGWEYKANQG